MDNSQIDALIIEAASAHWTKVAVIISKVYDSFAGQGQDVEEDLAKLIAERLYILVDNGKLAAQGNMRRWRDGDVRLVGVE